MEKGCPLPVLWAGYLYKGAKHVAFGRKGVWITSLGQMFPCLPFLLGRRLVYSTCDVITGSYTDFTACPCATGLICKMGCHTPIFYIRIFRTKELFQNGCMCWRRAKQFYPVVDQFLFQLHPQWKSLCEGSRAAKSRELSRG